MTFILARHASEATFIARELGLQPPGSRQWHYLHDVKQLLGCNDIRIIYYGAYYEHPHYLEIAQQIRIIEATGKVERVDA